MTFGEGQWESENFGLKSVSQRSDWLSVQCLQETNFWLCSSCNHINRNSQDSVTHSHVDIQWKRFRKHEGRKISACSLSTASLKAWQHWCMESSLKGRFLALSHSRAYELLPEKKNAKERKKNPISVFKVSYHESTSDWNKTLLFKVLKDIFIKKQWLSHCKMLT